MAKRAEMSEAEIEAERAKAKQRAYLKALGRGGYVDAAEMQARIRKLHDVHQITFERISQKTGVDQATIKAHYHGEWSVVRGRRSGDALTTCTWATANAVMTTRFGPADVRQCIRSTGTQRRLRAMVAAGYPQRWLAETTGRPLAALNHFLLRGSIEVTKEHAAAVEQTYRKYVDTDPLDVGIPPRSKTYALGLARKHGYEPSICWDEDTIEDPAALPEWTGECGTPEGYRIHVRDHLPLCPACKQRVETQPIQKEQLIFHHENFARAMANRGMIIKDMVERTGISPDTLLRWRTGDRKPRYRALVERCAEALGIDSEVLMDPVEPPLLPSCGLEVNPPGLFNPYVLDVALNLNAISKKGAARILGVNEGSVENWVRRRARPKSPDVILPLLPEVGMTVEEFYQ
jgi:transcriptional regulator with XRE-family HTH domain